MNRKNTPLLILIFVALVIFMITSCTRPTPSTIETENNKLSKNSEYYNTNVFEYTYEGCEYIRIDGGANAWGAHKGNCKNPIHKENGSN